MSYLFCAFLLTFAVGISPGGPVRAVKSSPLAFQEGNPGHVQPEHNCSHKPKEGDNRVACYCNQGCTSENDKSCKSYCFKSFCDCAKEDCLARLDEKTRDRIMSGYIPLRDPASACQERVEHTGNCSH